MLTSVILIGYRASGKSTLGPQLAHALGWRFLDADRELERLTGTSLAQLVDREGMEGFRQREAQLLADILLTSASLVLATGGGVVLRPANRALLGRPGNLVVYLAAEASLLQARLSQLPGGRFPLTGQGLVQEVPQQLAEREPLYRGCAHLVLDAGLEPGLLLAQLERAVRSHLEKPA